MMILSIRNYLVFLLMAGLLACGGETSTSDGGLNPNDQTTPATSALGTPVNLSYRLSTQTTSQTGEGFTINYNDVFTVPLYLKSNGSVRVLAREFPRMVLRVCRSNSPLTDCDQRIEDLVFSDVDIVLDACGIGRSDNLCGPNDPTQFSGAITSTGEMVIQTVAIRVRVFIVEDDSDGFNADADDSGLFDLDRVVVQLTTGSVRSGILSADGQGVLNRAVKLVAAGIIPSSMPELGGANYLVELTGSFSQDPFVILR